MLTRDECNNKISKVANIWIGASSLPVVLVEDDELP
jgi:hypothetical protein